MKKLILTLGTTLVAFSPALVAISCGDDNTDTTSAEQKQANADRDQLTSFNKTNDVAISILEANKTTNATTFVEFDQAKATALGFGTLPTLTNGSTVTYSLVQSTAVAGSKATYSLVLKATKGASSATTAAKTLTSSDDVSNAQNEANADKEQLNSFNKTSDVAFATLEGKKTTNADTFVTFDQGVATALGFGTLPTLTNSSTVTYSLVQSTAVVGSKATYSLVLKATKGAAYATTTAKVLTSSDNVSATIVADSMSADQVMTELNRHLNIFMPMKASELIKDVNKAAFLSYLREIKTDTPIVFKNGANEHEMDFSSLQEDIDATINIIDNDLHAANKGKGGDIASGNTLMNKNMSPISALSNLMMGSNFAIGKLDGSMAPYFAISETILADDTLNSAQVLADNPFSKMLFKLNDLFENLVDSSAYTTWNSNKIFALPFSLMTTNQLVQNNFIMTDIKSGTFFDVDSNVSMLTQSGIKAGLKTSNFEALFTHNFFKFSVDVEATDSIAKTAASYSDKDSIIAAYPELTASNFADQNTPTKLNVLPSNWVQLTGETTGTIPFSSSRVMYVAPVVPSAGAKTYVATYFLRFDIDAMKLATSATGGIASKYFWVNPATGVEYTTAPTGASALPTGWNRTTDKNLTALNNATAKFYYAHSKGADCAFYYADFAYDQDYKDLVTAWATYKAKTFTNFTSTLDDAAVLALADSAWAPLDATALGIDASLFQIPDGFTLEVSFGASDKPADAPQRVKMNYRLSKGSHKSPNKFVTASSTLYLSAAAPAGK